LLFIEMLPLLFHQMKVRVILPFIIGVLVLLTPSLSSPWMIGSLFGTIRIIEIVFLAWIVAHFISDKRLYHRSVTAIAFSVIVVSVLAVWQFLLQHSVGGLWYWLGERSFSVLTPGIANASLSGNLVLRPYSMFPHPNVLGGFCVVVVCYLLYFPVHASHKFIRGLVLAAVFSGVLTTIISMSRSAILVLGLVLCFKLFQLGVKSLKHGLLLLVAGALLIGVLFTSGAFTRFSTLRTSDEALVVREELMGHAVKIFENNQLVGIGVANFLPVLAEQMPPLPRYQDLQPVHSLYLLILVETGLIGTAFFIIGILFCLYMIFGSTSHRFSKLILLTAILLLGLTDHYLYTIHQGQLMMGFVLGVILSRFERKDFTDLRAKNRGTGGQQLSSKKPVSSSSLKIPRTRSGRRTK